MFSRILVAYDGSDHAEKALATAVVLAKTHGAELHLCHTPEVPTPTIVVGSMVAALDVPMTSEQIAAAGNKVLTQAKEAAHTRGLPLTEVYLGAANPTAVILQTADKIDADLIVMGRRGLGALGALAMGSVSQSVSHGAKCACMTVL